MSGDKGLEGAVDGTDNPAPNTVPSPRAQQAQNRVGKQAGTTPEKRDPTTGSDIAPAANNPLMSGAKFKHSSTEKPQTTTASRKDTSMPKLPTPPLRQVRSTRALSTRDRKHKAESSE